MPTKAINDALRRRCTMACENCKRRKERCDGSLPCRRCTARNVEQHCLYTKLRGPPPLRRQNEDSGRRRQSSNSVAGTFLESPVSPPDAQHRPSKSSEQPASRRNLLGCDSQGDSIYFGESANESFLRHIRRLVSRVLGSCPFVDQQDECHVVDDKSEPPVEWDATFAPPAKPTPAQASCFVRWGMRATNDMLGVVREADVQAEVTEWLELADDPPGTVPGLSTALYYLILAKGALSCPQDEDRLAHAYYVYATHLMRRETMDEPRVQHALCYIWIAFYQLGTGKRNAAYNSVGVAVRAAHSTGIHRPDFPASQDSPSYAFRERLWKALRKLDTFISGSLGRPLCTIETHDTKAESGYSSTIDITAILEAVLREVYMAFKTSKDFAAHMSNEHRLWTARIADGLKADEIETGEFVEHCDHQPNLAFYNIRESYYWSIMLLTRPFLLERASGQAPNTKSNISQPVGQSARPQDSQTDMALVYAGVDSAVHTIDLLRQLLTTADLPKRLPFVVNSSFGAALTLGVAVFADLEQIFPLLQSLQAALELLRNFESHDPVAKHYTVVVKGFQSTCEEYVARRNRQTMESQSQLVGDLFGRVHEAPPVPIQMTGGSSASWTESLAGPLPLQHHGGSPTTGFAAGDFTLDLELGDVDGVFSDLAYANHETHMNSFLFSSF